LLPGVFLQDVSMDDVTIANRAVARIGGIQVQSFASPGPSGFIVPETYNSVLEDLLGKYPWHFTKKKAALQRSPAPVDSGWTWAFKFANDRLAPPRGIYLSPSDRKPFHDWEPAGDGVLSNAEQLYGDFQYRPQPSWWPTYFRELVILAVAAELALALREDAGLRSRLRRDCYGDEQYQGEGGQFAVCTALDAQAQPSPIIDGGRNPLTDIRHSPGDARAGFEDW
jgi:hypothetical protein